MKRMSGVVFLFFVVALAGCEVVSTPKPLGDEVVKLDPATWQGTWLSDGIVVLTTVLDRGKGQLQAAWVERGMAGAKFELVTGTVRRTGNVTFLSMERKQFKETGEGAATAQEQGEPAVEQPEFLWARIENDGRRVILWWPDTEQIRLAVNDGRLQGVIKKDKDIILQQPDAAQLKLINSPAANLMRWSQPVVFIRIGD